MHQWDCFTLWFTYVYMKFLYSMGSRNATRQLSQELFAKPAAFTVGKVLKLSMSLICATIWAEHRAAHRSHSWGYREVSPMSTLLVRTPTLSSTLSRYQGQDSKDQNLRLLATQWDTAHLCSPVDPAFKGRCICGPRFCLPKPRRERSEAQAGTDMYWPSVKHITDLKIWKKICDF